MKRIIVIPVNSGLNLNVTKVIDNNYIEIENCTELVKIVVTPEAAKLDFN